MANASTSNATSIVSPVVQDNTAPAAHSNVLAGAETQAEQIVSQNRDTANETTQKVAGSGGAFNGMDILDQDSADGLNNVTPAAGTPMAPRGQAANLNVNSGIDRSVVAHTLDKPAAGHTTTVKVQPGEVLATNFDPDSANLDMHGKDLVMQFNDGSKIVLSQFAADTQNMPSIALPNGALVAGGVIIAQLQGTDDDLFNLQTAAGGTLTSGRFTYSDDFGNVIGLLNKLPPIGFTSLQFQQPEPRPTINDLTDFGADGGFTTVVTSVDSISGGFGAVIGAFEDWMPHKNVGDMTIVPAALSIAFTPDDNEVVDQVTISNIPAGVQFFYGTTSNYTSVPVINGTVTFTGTALANGTIFILDTAKSSTDIPLTISMTIRDPDTNQTAVITQNTVVIVDAVADMPSMTSTVSIDASTITSGGAITGNEGHPVNVNMNVTFSDNDGSETHGIVIQGVPAEWTIISSPGVTLVVLNNTNGIITYGATVTGNVNTVISFDTHEWSSTAQITVTAGAQENVTDGEITSGNNTAQVSTSFAVSILEDTPTITTVNGSGNANGNISSINEHELLIPGTDHVGGDIVVEYNTDAPGSIAMNLNGLSALNLTSHGETLTYTLSADGSQIVASNSQGAVFTINLTTGATNGSQQTYHYDFVLSQPIDHPDGTSADVTQIPVQFTATDSDGDSVSGTINLGIVDDVPVAHDDVITLGNGNSILPGNLLANDTLSADVVNHITQVSFNGTTVSFASAGQTDANGTFVLVNGQYGQIKVYENGNYVYTYDNANHSGNLTEQFTYTLVDGDGDSSTANISLTINDNAPGTPPVITLTTDETTDLGQTITGTVTVPGATTYTLDPVNNPGLTSNGVPVVVTNNNGHYTGTANGQPIFDLTLNPNGTYTFTQTGPLDHADPNNPNDVITITVPYSASDNDGDTVHGNIVINISDDAPIAVNDTGFVADGTASVPGNLLSNDDLSVDAPNHITQITFNGMTTSFATSGQTDAGGQYVLINGQFGTIKVYENGSYIYNYDTTNHSGNLTEQFTYTLVDGDGDSSTANLTVTINDSAPGAVPNITITTDETTDLGQTVTGTVTVPGATTYTLDQVNNPTLTSNGVAVTVVINNGHYTGTANGQPIFDLTLNPNGTYTFTQTGPLDHADPNNPNDVITITVPYSASDNDGDTVHGNIVINIQDDAPIANDDINTGAVNAASVDGNVLANDVLSHDTPNTLSSISFNGTTLSFALPAGIDANGKFLVINGDHGQLKIYENGQYSYVPDVAHNPGAVSLGDNFTYTVVDGDGDTSQANLSVIAQPSTFELVVNNGSENAIVKEDGQISVPFSVHYVGGASNETLTLTLSGVQAGWTVTAPGWTLHPDGTYTLTTSMANSHDYISNITFAPPHDADADMNGLQITASISDPDLAGQPLIISDNFNIITDAVVDMPVFSVPADLGYQQWYAYGNEYRVPLQITANVTDIDGSEQLTKLIVHLENPMTAGAPPFMSLADMGVTLNMGTQIAHGVWEVPINAGNAASLAGLQLIVPNDHNYYPIHLGVTGNHVVNITLELYTQEVNLSGNEVDTSDNTVVVTANTGFGLYITPLALDLNGNGIETVNMSQGVMFDMTNDGVRDHTSWIAPTDGLLALDKNGDHIINSQSELFGNDATHANGFDSLASYDLDHNGFIDHNDAVFSQLIVWQDINQDGISQANEMFSLTDLGIASINVHGVVSGQTSGDSIITHTGSFTYTNGHQGTVADVGFHVVDDTAPNTGTTFNGTAHNDVIQGTARDDVFIMSNGNDIITGGAGADTFSFVKDATGSNTITDYNFAQNDKLDIRDLLVGSNYAPGISHVDDYVKIDHATGNVFVDASGHGAFNQANQIATLNNVSSIDAVHIILNEDEGTKTIHTV